jgi:tol-pal system protein YbgF
MLLAIATLAVLSAGCASRAALKQTQQSLSDLRAEVAGLRRSHEVHLREIARTAAEIRSLDGRNAELQTALREQSTEAARLRERLDAAEQELHAAKAPARTSVPDARPDAVEPDEATRDYDLAMENFRAREHGQAVLDFMDFIGKHPQHPLAPSAQYWIGEAYYVQRDYRQAVIEFERAVDMAPSSPTAADALLKIGMAHTNLRENSRAQQAWQRVVQDYPASESAGKARALLREHAARRP